MAPNFPSRLHIDQMKPRRDILSHFIEHKAIPNTFASAAGVDVKLAFALVEYLMKELVVDALVDAYPRLSISLRRHSVG